MNWIAFVAGRLVVRKRGSPSPVLAILGIAVGVLALTVIISVMNGFQLGFIESILEISSYYVQVESFTDEESAEKNTASAVTLMEEIKIMPGVNAVIPFREVQALIRGDWGQQAVVVRGLPYNAYEEDTGMAEKLVFEEGYFKLTEGTDILLGAELASRLRIGLGDTIQLISISGSGSLTQLYTDRPENTEEPSAAESFFTVTGIFRSGFYEYDLGWGFINFEKAGELAGPSYALGIKLDDRWQDRRIAASLTEIIEASGFSQLRIRSWRDFNRAFFGALRTEKLFMFVLVGLIFIVVGLNIYQAQRRIVLERREEIGLLRAVGAGDRAVRLVFVWDGLIIGLTGAVSGTALGLFISFNIAAFFSLLENIVNAILALFYQREGFAIFSPAVFYIKELKARVIPQEVLLIFLFGVFSALGASWFASGRVSRIKPAEVLRYE